jgi:hypothetical protein
MLNLNHPMTDHVFRALHLVGAVTTLAYQMTVAPSSVRQRLFEECLPKFDAVRAHNIDHFGGDDFIAQAIDEYEESLRKLAALGDGLIVEDRKDGEGDCPYCGTKITKIPLTRDRTSFIIVCGRCDDLFSPALEKLHSHQGFGICAI